MTSNIILQYRIAIVISRFNKEISDNLLQGALDEYNQICKDSCSNIDIFDVPGAFEIPGTIMKILKNNKKYHAIIALGNVIKGETAHFEYISSSVTNSISKISVNSDIPILYGILTAYNYEQALKRSNVKQLNKGGEVMNAAIKTIETYNKIL